MIERPFFFFTCRKQHLELGVGYGQWRQGPRRNWKQRENYDIKSVKLAAKRYLFWGGRRGYIIRSFCVLWRRALDSAFPHPKALSQLLLLKITYNASGPRSVTATTPDSHAGGPGFKSRCRPTKVWSQPKHPHTPPSSLKDVSRVPPPKEPCGTVYAEGRAPRMTKKKFIP